MSRRLATGLAALATGVLLGFASAAGSHAAAKLTGITRWLNVSGPVTPEQLKGKVVLVSFWTYSCINCIRTMPYLKAWYDRYHAKGLEIIAVHTPEFHFEKNPENVQAAIRRFGLPYPVAMDDDYRTWDAFGSRTWPSDFLIDAHGVVRFKHFGEAHYDEIEAQISQLLAASRPAAPLDAVAGLESVNFSKIKTRQIYLGLLRLSSLGNAETIVPGQVQTFAEPSRLKKHKAYLVGQWSLGKESARLVSPEGKLRLRFEASRVNIVLSPEGNRDVWAEILIDGHPATAENRGKDVLVESGQARCKIDFSRMYNFTATDYGPHELEVRFHGAGIKAFTITFG